MTPSKKTCFVLMPFDDKYKEVYEQVYRPVCEQNKLHCWRVDEISAPGSITNDIVEGIIDSDIIIADLTSRNPNVFYELGIAHTVGNNVIMTCQEKSDVPFDIAAYRIIFYQQTISGSKLLGEKLNDAIKELLEALDRTNNPVQNVLSTRKALHVRKPTPLFKVVDTSLLSTPLNNLLENNNILYVDDLKKLDIDSVASKSGFGHESIKQLAYLIQKLDLYGDPVKFQQFLKKYHITFHKKYPSRNWKLLVESIDQAAKNI